MLIYFVDQSKQYADMDYVQAGEVQKYRDKYRREGVYSEYVNGTEIKNDLYRTIQIFLAKKAVKDRKEITNLMPDNSQLNSTPVGNINHVKAKNLNIIAEHRDIGDIMDSGTCDFDYSNNDGKYEIKTWVGSYATQWSRAGKTAIHVCAIDGICKIGFNATDPTQLSENIIEDDFDFSSRVRTLQKNEVVLLKYHNDFVLVKVRQIEDRMSGDSKDRLSIEFINFARV
ncbi:hypothetical protein [Paenibacillus shenyangensis]|uniref:hypothetical protein n=1 Tax=Paenibacillus sp. A9 TaxID=1284352 RepID=UPI0003770F97|nr:hypothetical protein [Paenibacillus sp. A9]